MSAFERVSIDLHPQQSGQSPPITLDARIARLPTEAPPDDGFEPRDHRTPRPKALPVHMAYFNILRTGFSAGILGMPMAISNAGFILGPVMSVIFGVLVIHSYFVLLWSLNEISRQLKIPYISYRYGFRLALLHGPINTRFIGDLGPFLVALFMIVNQLGICSIFVVHCADSLRDMLDWEYFSSALVVMFLPYLLFEYLITDLKYVSYMSIIGNFTNAIAVGLIVFIFVDEPHGEVIYIHTNPVFVITAFGCMLFNFSNIAVILTIDKNLQNPKIMTSTFGIINVGIGSIAIVSTIMGTIGCWSLGMIEETVVRALPYEDNISMITMGLYFLTISSTYPIQCYAGIQMALEVIKNYNMDYILPMKVLNRLDYVLRTIFVSMSFVIAYFIPYQSPLVALTGNLCSTILTLVFPNLMDLCIRYNSHHGFGRFKWILIKDVVLVCLGSCWFIFGVFLTAYLIYVRILLSRAVNNQEYL